MSFKSESLRDVIFLMRALARTQVTFGYFSRKKRKAPAGRRPHWKRVIAKRFKTSWRTTKQKRFFVEVRGT
jgi:hypothetical protein